MTLLRTEQLTQRDDVTKNIGQVDSGKTGEKVFHFK